MKRPPHRARRQRGFTLVEMSVTMAAAGLMFAAVTSGQELIEQGKAAKLLNDVKAVEANLQRFAQLKGRLPGDCNADGQIDYAADARVSFTDVTPPVREEGNNRSDSGNSGRAAEYAYSVLLPTIPGDGDPAEAQTAGCAAWGGAQLMADVTISETNANVWINDLKLAGVISDSVPNRKYAKLVHEDFMFVGSVADAGTDSAVGANYNAIVIHNVPQWMARRLATAINGQDAVADRSRVRQLARTTFTDGTYVPRWENVGGNDTMRDSMVTVAYFFDRVPESQASNL